MTIPDNPAIFQVLGTVFRNYCTFVYMRESKIVPTGAGLWKFFMISELCFILSSISRFKGDFKAEFFRVLRVLPSVASVRNSSGYVNSWEIYL